MLRSELLAVLFRGDDLERFVIAKHGKDDVADLMHDSAHCCRSFLAGALPGVVVVNYRIHRCAAPFINLYVIECDHVKNPSGKVGTAFGHMDFSFVSINTEDDDETEELVDFSDVDYEDDRLGKTNLIMLYYKKVVLGMVGGSMEIELKRDIYEELLQWKKRSSGLVLELEGARQVGKTYILDKFAREQYQQYIYINMIGESGEYFLECYEKAYHRRNVQDEAENGMAAVLKTYAPNFVDSRETIVVIDEIQESPVIYSRIREFAREFSCDFIVTGSYLGKTREKEFFLSAGDTDTLVMGTLSFPEFLGAFGKRDLYETLTLDGKDDHARYDEIKDYFDLYCQLGGYPRVVQNYLETGDLSQSRRLVERIIDIFIKESSRYFESELDIEIFGQLFQAIAIMLLKEKRGTEDLVTDLSKIVFKEESGRVSKKMINHARSWLYLSHVIGYCSKSINCDHLSIVDNCRYYYMDLGVAAYFLRKTGESDTATKGILCENFVYLELLNRLRNTDSIAGTVPWFAVYQQTGGELDFYVRSLLDYKNYGLEVKAGKSAGNTASTLLEAGLLDFLYYLKGNTYGGITEDGKIQTVPLYLAGRVRFDKGV